MRPRQLSRLLSIVATLYRYRLDELVDSAALLRPIKLIRVFMPWGRRRVKDLPRGVRIRRCLVELGPIFVKFGQILSTRRDLLPVDIADELAVLQDQVEAFPGEVAQSMVEQALGAPVAELFSQFSIEPLASASIAQVHQAELVDGRAVAVKVLRPGVEAMIRRDVDLLLALARMTQRYWHAGENVRPVELVQEFEKTIFDELDLTREAANASQLKRNFADDPELKVPDIYWPYTHKSCLVMEFVHGIPIGNRRALEQAGVNLQVLAERGVRIFYTQVFRDNFFHADMHPGNIMVDAADPENPTFVALDFGIVGSLPTSHLHYLAENFTALFEQDYLRVAQLHVESGWVPATTRVEDLAHAARAVCEPMFARPLSEISFGELMFQLFGVARRFNLIVQPELVMLQKTLLNIEGLGRDLYPQLDIWATAQPILRKILSEQQGLDRLSRDLRTHLPAWMEKTPELPGLIHAWLSRANEAPTPQHHASSAQQAGTTRAIVRSIRGAVLTLAGVLLFALKAEPLQLGPVPMVSATATLLGLWWLLKD